MSFEFSQSKMKVWRHCRNAYYYKYIMKITKKHKNVFFLRGEIIHDMLEQHYLGNDPWKAFKKQMEANQKILSHHREEYGDLEGLIRTLMTGYFKFYKGEPIKPIKVEHEFRVLMDDKIYVTGKIDLIARETKQKLNLMTEHKCHNKIPNDSIVPFTNLQSSLYLWAVEKELDMKLDGTLWNYLLGKPLSTPMLLKSGEMSRKNINTTWPIYRDALKAANLEPEDYFDMRERLKGNEQQIYQRKIIPADKTMTDNIIQDTLVTAKEMRKYGGKDRTRNLSRDCDGCEFKNLCLAQLKGHDDNFILKSDFKERKKKYE